MSDLMAGFTFVLLLLIGLFLLQVQQQKRQLAKQQQAAQQERENLREPRESRDAILKAIENELKDRIPDHATSIRANTESGVLTVDSNGIGFAPTSKVYLESTAPFVGALAGVLDEILPCFLNCPGGPSTPRCAEINPPGACLSAVFIEGHSDSDKWTGKTQEQSDDLNTVLSAQRALSTLNGMATERPALGTLENDEDLHLWAVAGYGSKRPLNRKNQTSEGAKAKNRRIDFRFVMAPVDLPDLEPIP